MITQLLLSTQRCKDKMQPAPSSLVYMINSLSRTKSSMENKMNSPCSGQLIWMHGPLLVIHSWLMMFLSLMLEAQEISKLTLISHSSTFQMLTGNALQNWCKRTIQISYVAKSKMSAISKRNAVKSNLINKEVLSLVWLTHLPKLPILWRSWKANSSFEEMS